MSGINGTRLKTQFSAFFVDSSVIVPTITQNGLFIAVLIEEIPEFNFLVVTENKEPVEEAIDFVFGGINIIIEDNKLYQAGQLVKS